MINVTGCVLCWRINEGKHKNISSIGYIQIWIILRLTEWQTICSFIIINSYVFVNIQRASDQIMTRTTITIENRRCVYESYLRYIQSLSMGIYLKEVSDGRVVNGIIQWILTERIKSKCVPLCLFWFCWRAYDRCLFTQDSNNVLTTFASKVNVSPLMLISVNCRLLIYF